MYMAELNMPQDQTNNALMINNDVNTNVNINNKPEQSYNNNSHFEHNDENVNA